MHAFPKFVGACINHSQTSREKTIELWELLLIENAEVDLAKFGIVFSDYNTILLIFLHYIFIVQDKTLHWKFCSVHAYG